MLCAAVLLCTMLTCALPAAATGDEKVYFMSVNDVVLELEADTMPRMINGVLYVPYTMFDSTQTNGASLGVFASYGRGKEAVIIYNRVGTLVFDLKANNSTFSGTTYSDKAVIRNSMVFVPVEMVCRLFGLEWSRLTVDHGYIVRVKNEDVVLRDSVFADAATFAVNERYQRYLQTQAENPASRPSTTPTPSVNDSSANGARVYLAFRMEDGTGFSGVLEQLRSYDVYGIFFCSPRELSKRDDDIRSLLAAGHRIGLLLDADTLNGQLKQVQQGRQLLEHIAWTEPTVYLSENLSSADEAALAGQVCLWKTTLDAVSEGRSVSRQAAVVTNAVRANRKYFALMDDCDQSTRALTRILSALTDGGCKFRLVNEVVLKK